MINSDAFYGLPLNTLRRRDVCPLLFEHGKRGQHVVTLNPLIFLKTRRDKTLREAVRRAALVIPDGAGLVWAARRCGIPLSERIAGIDLVYDLLAYADRQGLSMYLLGGHNDTINRTAANIRKLYSGIRLVGFHPGYYPPERAGDIITAMRKAAPDILLVGLGGGTQEVWIDRVLRTIQPIAAVGVGGSFDILSGKRKRAPLWFRQRNLEWFYRMFTAPWRAWQIFPLFYFVILVFLTGKKKPLAS